MRTKIKAIFNIYVGIILVLTLSDCKESKEVKYSNSLISANEISNIVPVAQLKNEKYIKKYVVHITVIQ